MLPDEATFLQLTKTARSLFAAVVICLWSLPLLAQSLQENPIRYDDIPANEDRYMRDMDDLMHARLQKEREATFSRDSQAGS
jgi:hypothetical protein